MFSKILRKLRRDKDVTQEQLAEYLNISKQAVSKWETGNSQPDMEMQIKLAKYFDVTIDYLLGRNIKDDEYMELYNQVYNDPNLKIMFDQVKDLSKDELRWVLGIVKQVKDDHEKNN